MTLHAVCRFAPIFAASVLLVGTRPALAASPWNEVNAKLDQLLNQTAPGFDISRHVMLAARFSDTTSCALDDAYFRIHPDGTQDADEFVVPEGHTLIITDISWNAFKTPTDWAPGRTLQFALSSQQPDGSMSLFMYNSAGIDITADNENGRLSGSESLRTGIAVGPGRIVCPRVTNTSQSGFALNSVGLSYLRGVLVPE